MWESELLNMKNKLYTKVAKTNGRKDSYLKIIRKKIFLLILLLSNLKLQKLWSYIYSATMENVLNIRTQYSAGSASSRRSWNIWPVVKTELLYAYATEHYLSTKKVVIMMLYHPENTLLSKKKSDSKAISYTIPFIEYQNKQVHRDRKQISK